MFSLFFHLKEEHLLCHLDRIWYFMRELYSIKHVSHICFQFHFHNVPLYQLDFVGPDTI